MTHRGDTAPAEKKAHPDETPEAAAQRVQRTAAERALRAPIFGELVTR